jgi:hypothetical protein
MPKKTQNVIAVERIPAEPFEVVECSGGMDHVHMRGTSLAYLDEAVKYVEGIARKATANDGMKRHVEVRQVLRRTSFEILR